jgi:hypothetical protein
MSDYPSYSFLPWLRQGIANTIATADSDASVKTRATINVALQATGAAVGGGAPVIQTVSQDIALYGPGDIIGIDAKAILRTDPRPWITNYESNYLAAVEFYDEDFPWRYTPAAPDASGLHLRPWIFLLVLKEGEFTEGENTLGRPLPYIAVTDTSLFPPVGELWAWAHVHFNQTIAGSATELVSPDMGAVLPRVQTLIARNPDVAYARIVSPRRLDENSAYHAFVVPTFETGRLAGLGDDPSAAPHATFSATDIYAGKPDATFFPIYYRWFFRTGAKGDFEYLVGLLKAQPVNSRVGARDMDVLDPGSNIPPISDSALGGVLPLGGALRVPDADLSPSDLQQRQAYENWDQPYPHPFERALAAFIDLPDAYAASSAAAANAASGLGPGVADDPDPLITAPLYGRWHALTQRLLTNRDGTPAPNNSNWVHRLNLDPRFRVPAAFGASVVETNAEEYMNDAWQQIGDVLAANQRIRQLHLAVGVSVRWYDTHLTPLAAANSERAFTLAAPVAGRVVSAGTTVARTQSASLVPPTLTSAAFRRVLRPGARLMRGLPFSSTATPGNLLTRVNAGTVSAAPPKPVPPALPTIDQAAGAAHPSGAPPQILAWLAQYPWLPLAVLIAAAILGLIALVILLVVSVAVGLALLVLIAVVAWFLYTQLTAWQFADGPAQTLAEGNQVPSAVANMPANPNFQISDPGSTFRPQPGESDSPTATRFKAALSDWYALRVASQTAAQRPAPTTLDLAGLTATMLGAIDPRVTIPRRGLSFLGIPPWIRQLIGDAFNEVMAYPKIDLPMYKPLKDISIELFLPNINLIPENSITLIETNRRFIEAYMVGLNHEFARKLLWRGYPTDQRGSYFRQFWDVGSYIDSEGLSTDALKEKLYDIPPLHLWPAMSNLGDHNNRGAAGSGAAQAVLVIRGELLKRYPTAVIFAQHAKWAMKNGQIDTSQPRSLDEPTAAEETNPPRSKIRSPLYEAKADPDIYFFGFDLTIDEAKGQSGQHPTDDPGWFFVIKQRPGEPRFGLELTRPGPITIFDKITWSDVTPAVAPGQCLGAGNLASVALATPAPSDPDLDQHADDVVVNAAAPSAARWAYLLFRAPVMVAVHADQMLA